MEQSSKDRRDRHPFKIHDRVFYPSKCSRDALSGPKLEASTAKSVARVEQLDKARERIDQELLQWTMQVQLAEDAAYCARISQSSAEDEDRSVADTLRTLEADLDLLLTSDAAEALSEVWAEAFLTATARLDALRERQLEARLKLQICRRHCQLQNEILEHARAALQRAEQRNSAIGEEVAALRREPEQHSGSALRVENVSTHACGAMSQNPKNKPAIS